ncbi:MAG: hypothetical protein WCK02_12485 [Bacteroidota bacterium]
MLKIPGNINLNSSLFSGKKYNKLYNITDIKENIEQINTPIIPPRESELNQKKRVKIKVKTIIIFSAVKYSLNRLFLNIRLAAY